MRPRVVKVFVAALLVSAAWFIWPTPWTVYGRGDRVIRVHRITGKTEVLFVTGWRPWPSPQPQQP